MKLKQAKKFAKEIDFKWVTVDEDGEIYAYKHKPNKYENFWEYSIDTKNNVCFLGKYTGKKKWNKTLRRVK